MKENKQIDNVKLAIKLLQAQLDHDIRIAKLDEALGKCDLAEAFPLDLLDIVADLLGVPQDNYYELDAKYGMEKYVLKHDKYPDEYYSRDWCWDIWYGYENDVDREEYINWFIKTMAEHTLEYRMANAN